MALLIVYFLQWFVLPYALLIVALVGLRRVAEALGIVRPPTP
jgi:hypothetical protein